MKDEIKEILDICVLEGELTIDYIDKSGIKKEYEGISDEALSYYITKLEKEKAAIKERCEYLQRSCERKEEQMLYYRDEYLCQEDYKTRNDKAINEIIRVLQIILEQPSKDKTDDLWIINKLEGIQILLQGEDNE